MRCHVGYDTNERTEAIKLRQEHRESKPMHLPPYRRKLVMHVHEAEPAQHSTCEDQRSEWHNTSIKNTHYPLNCLRKEHMRSSWHSAVCVRVNEWVLYFNNERNVPLWQHTCLMRIVSKRLARARQLANNNQRNTLQQLKLSTSTHTHTHTRTYTRTYTHTQNAHRPWQGLPP